MQRVPRWMSSSVPALAGLSGLVLAGLVVAGCVERDGLSFPDGGRAGTTGGTGSAGASGEAGTTGASGTTGSGTGTAGSTGAGTAGTTGAGTAGTTGTTGQGGSTGAAGQGGQGGKAGSGDMCGPVCEIFCRWGNVTDAAGCPTCKCNPPPACQPSECPPQAALPVPQPCGGKVIPPVCSRGADGACAWTPSRCDVICPAIGCDPKCDYGVKTDPNGCPTCQCNPPPPTCTKAQCGPAPLLPSMICPDGTVAGPVCGPTAAGTCGWTITKCPPTVCPAIACLRACPNGARVDANGCTTCDCLDPSDCATHADFKNCQADARCTWLQPGCGTPALATPGCFARTDVGCQSDANCSGQRQCLKRVINPCYAPAGGITCAACGSTQTVCL